MARVNGTINKSKSASVMTATAKPRLPPSHRLQAQHERPRGHDDRECPDERRQERFENPVIGGDEHADEQHRQRRPGQITGGGVLRHRETPLAFLCNSAAIRLMKTLQEILHN